MDYKFRVGITKKDGKAIAKNFNTKEEVDDFVLEVAEQSGVRYYRIIDRRTKEVIESGKDL